MRICGSNAHLLQQSIHLNKLSRLWTLKHNHDIKSYQYHFIILLKTKELPQIKHTRKEFIHKVIYHLAYIIEISIWNMIWIVQIFWFAKNFCCLIMYIIVILCWIWNMKYSVDFWYVFFWLCWFMLHNLKWLRNEIRYRKKFRSYPVTLN